MTAGVLKPSNRIRVSTSRKVFLVINTVLLLLLCAAMLYPVIFVTAASFSEETAILKGEVSIFPVRSHVKA